MPLSLVQHSNASTSHKECLSASKPLSIAEVDNGMNSARSNNAEKHERASARLLVGRLRVEGGVENVA